MNPTPVNILTLFLTVDRLILEPSLQEELRLVFNHGDDTEFAALLASVLPNELTLEEKLDTVKAFYNISIVLNSIALETLGDMLSMKPSTPLFKKISQMFLEVEESWEEVIGKEHFVLFSKLHDGQLKPKEMPLQRVIIVNHILAHSGERLKEAQEEGYDHFELATVLLDKLVEEQAESLS